MNEPIKADIMRLSANSVVHGALLLSLFETHPDQDAVIEAFSTYAKILDHILWCQPNLPETASSEQEQAFHGMMDTLTRIARKHDQR